MIVRSVVDYMTIQKLLMLQVISPCTLFGGRCPVALVHDVVVAVDRKRGPTHKIHVLFPGQKHNYNSRNVCLIDFCLW